MTPVQMAKIVGPFGVHPLKINMEPENTPPGKRKPPSSSLHQDFRFLWVYFGLFLPIIFNAIQRKPTFQPSQILHNVDSSEVGIAQLVKANGDILQAEKKGTLAGC